MDREADPGHGPDGRSTVDCRVARTLGPVMPGGPVASGNGEEHGIRGRGRAGRAAVVRFPAGAEEPSSSGAAVAPPDAEPVPPVEGVATGHQVQRSRAGIHRDRPDRGPRNRQGAGAERRRRRASRNSRRGRRGSCPRPNSAPPSADAITAVCAGRRAEEPKRRRGAEARNERHREVIGDKPRREAVGVQVERHVVQGPVRPDARMDLVPVAPLSQPFGGNQRSCQQSCSAGRDGAKPWRAAVPDSRRRHARYLPSMPFISVIWADCERTMDFAIVLQRWCAPLARSVFAISTAPR